MGNKSGKSKKNESLALTQSAQPASDIECSPVHHTAAPRPAHYYTSRSTVPRTITISFTDATAQTLDSTEPVVDKKSASAAADSGTVIKLLDGRSDVQEPLEIVLDSAAHDDHTTTIAIASDDATATEATSTVEIQIEDVNGDVTVVVEGSSKHHAASQAPSDANASASLFDYPELYGQKLPPPDDLPPSILEELEPRRTSLPPSTGVAAGGWQGHFPSTGEVKRRLALFSASFTQSLIDKYSALPYQRQLAGLSVALRITDHASDVITLEDYVTGVKAVPIDLSGEEGEGGAYYVPTLPEALVLILVQGRICSLQGAQAEAFWQTVARDILHCIAMETASELSRMFEYQLVIACDDATLRLMAEYAADCVVGATAAAGTMQTDTEKGEDNEEGEKATGTPLDRNVALFAVVTGTKPDRPYCVTQDILTRQLSAVVQSAANGGQQIELKWLLGDVFRKPGLRRETLLTNDPQEASHEPSFRFYGNALQHDQLTYGYRGQFIEWDYACSCYRLEEDEALLFPEELNDLPPLPGDFHRLYRPYKRLVGYEAMKHYCQQQQRHAGSGKSSTPRASLVKVMHEREDASINSVLAHRQDELQPVYRPVQQENTATTNPPFNFGRAQLDGVDLARCRIKRADWSQFSAKGASLLASDLRLDSYDAKKIKGLAGANISYSRLVSSGAAILPRNVTAVYVTLGCKSVSKSSAAKGEGQTDNKDLKQFKAKAISNDKQVVLPLDKVVQEKQKQIEAYRKQQQQLEQKSQNEAKKEENKKTKSVNAPKSSSKNKSKTIDTNSKRVSSPEEKLAEPDESQTQQRNATPAVTEENVIKVTSSDNQENPPPTKKGKIKKASKSRPTCEPPSIPTHAVPAASSEEKQQQQAAEKHNVSFQNDDIKAIDDVTIESAVEAQLNVAVEAPPVSSQPQTSRDQPDTAQKLEEEVKRRSSILKNAGMDAEASSSKEPADISEKPWSEIKPATADDKSTKKNKEKRFKPKRSKSDKTEEKSNKSAKKKVTTQSKDNKNNAAADTATSASAPTSPGGTRKATTTTTQQQEEDDTLNTSIISNRGNHLGRAPNDVVNQSVVSARSFLSMADQDNVRKSQVFAMIEELQAKQVSSNLPTTETPLHGRERDIEAVSKLLTKNRLVIMTGCPGIGKASLATAVATHVTASSQSMVPFVVDARGSSTCDGVLRQLLRLFGLHFRLRPRDLAYFCNWLNALQSSLLLVFTNVDVASDQWSHLSAMLDRLATGVSDVRILCTSSRNFYSGKTRCQVYPVEDLGAADTKRVVLYLAPDLHEEGVDELTLACENVLLGVYLTAKTCLLSGVDPGQLFVDVTNSHKGVLNHAKIWDIAGLAADDDVTRHKLAKVMGVVDCVIAGLPASHQKVLEMISVFASHFDAAACAYVTGQSEQGLAKILQDLVDVGLIVTVQDKKYKTLYHVEGLVKSVARAVCKQKRGDEALLKYCDHFTNNKLKAMADKFWSAGCAEAISEFDDNFDNFIDVIEHVIDSDKLLAQMSYASAIETVIFFATVLPDKLYLILYDSLAQLADTNGDVQTMANALCALSYYYTEMNKPDRARSFALRALEVLQAVPPGSAEDQLDKTFCWQSLGRALWHEVEERSRAQVLLKRALDVTQAVRGVRHLRTLIANELYAAQLTHAGNYQMARHCYNSSDAALVAQQQPNAEHLFFLPGLECRRIIWDKLGLCQRSAELAQRSAAMAQRYHGDHPQTAASHARYGDCMLRQGNVHEAFRATITALGIRSRVLGQHVDTALTNKTLAILLLKIGQPEEALRYCNVALNIYETLKYVDDSLKADVHHLIVQARNRQKELTTSGSSGAVASNAQLCIAA